MQRSRRRGPRNPAPLATARLMLYPPEESMMLDEQRARRRRRWLTICGLLALYLATASAVAFG